MNKFLKKFFPVLVFILLTNLFVGIIWAVTFVEKSKSNWLDGSNSSFSKQQVQIDKDNASNYSYDKVNENYIVSLPTYGLITPANETAADEYDLTNGIYKFDIDQDGSKTMDYQIKLDTWKVSVPLTAPLVISRQGISGQLPTLISPVITLENLGDKPVDVSVDVIEKQNTASVSHKDINLVDKVNVSGEDDLYLGILAYSNIENGFENLPETSLGNAYNGNGNSGTDIYLGTLEPQNSTKSKGKILFTGQVTDDFLIKHETGVGINNPDPITYTMKYRFSKPTQTP